MGAVGVLARFEIRRRWPGTVAIALLVGVVGAIVLATAAGARRSDTALDRFNRESRSAALEISIGTPKASKVAEFGNTPGVAAIARLRGYSLEVAGQPNLAIAAPLDATMGQAVDRARLITGRRADPSAANEIEIGEGLSSSLHLGLGDHLRVQTYVQGQITRAFAGGDPGAPAGPPVTFDVVGIVRRPLDLGVRAASGVIVLTPAFHDRYQGRIGQFTDVLRVRTDGNPGDLSRVGAAARRIFGRAEVFGSEGLGSETEGARNAIDVLTLALWIVAGVTALAGFVAIGIVLTRDIADTSLDQATLRALGLTQRQRILANAPRILMIAAGGAIVAGIGAVLLSPLLPIGVARRADPNPGLHADWTVLALAVPLTGLVVLGMALLASARATRVVADEVVPRAYRGTSALVERAASAGLRPTAINGLRMAIQSGRGKNAVPVRSAFVGAVFGVAGITTALVFAASLNHLVKTPQLYGWNWDVKVEVPTADPCVDVRDYGLAKDPAVKADGVVCPANSDPEIDGRPVTVWGFTSLHGTIDPTIVAGRAARGPREIALGAVTLSALGKRIGDTVKVRGPHRTLEYRVVGRLVLPTMDAPQPLADGAAVTGAGFRPLYDAGGNETHFLVARFQPGTDRSAIRRRAAAIPQSRNVSGATLPVEVTRLQQIDRIPASVAGLLGVLALLAVGHALVTAVRRRRAELALLKVLGFENGQVRATVAWQATVLGAVGVVLGIPIGIIVGRLVWHLVAGGLGVSTDVTAPTLALILLVPSALLVVNLVAFLPARAAARIPPAGPLRAV